LVENVLRIRTGETGEQAVWTNGSKCFNNNKNIDFID
jgi:hypothetical protein